MMLRYMKLTNIVWITFVIAGFLILPSLAQAGDSVLSGSTPLEVSRQRRLPRRQRGLLTGYTEVGERSTAENYQEEDTDDDYTYHNYHLKFEQEISDRTSYDISSFIYNKDYKSKDSLDNISRVFKTNWDYNIKKDSLKLDFALKYKEKRYNNTPSSEYDQRTASPKITFRKKDLYTASITAGIDNFNYLERDEKDQFKIFGKVEGDRYLLDKKLMLTSYYRIENTEQKEINRKRTKHNLNGGFDYIFELLWVYEIIARADWGQRDTKEEDKDEDYDYEYRDYYAKTNHRISQKLETNLKYNYFMKDYLIADLDHRGFYIHQEWNYEVLNDEKQRFWLDFDAEHKDVDYISKTGNHYKKETAEIKATYRAKKIWKTSASIEGNFYDYDDSNNDKKRYYVKLSGEKLFLENSLTLSLDLKYRYTDYAQKDDIGHEAVRIAFKYGF